MIVYISGKITGDPDYRLKFGGYQLTLEAAGHTVLNPALNPPGLSNVDYMRLSFAAMEAAEVVAFLPDWSGSKGAMVERAWCQYVGKPTCMVADLLPAAAAAALRKA